MHTFHGVAHHPVEILVHAAEQVTSLMREVVGIHPVVVDEAATVHMLGLVVEADIVPVVGQIEFIVRRNVGERLRNGQGQMDSLNEGHWLFVVFVFAGVVVAVAILDANASSPHQMVGVRQTFLG